MSTTWTAVFTLPGLADTAEDLAASVNGFAGRALLGRLSPALAIAGWTFDEPFAEDHGWLAETARPVAGKSVVFALVGCPEGETLDDGRAEEDRWRIVVGAALGLFAGTKAARTEALADLARQVEVACLGAGAVDLIWENGPFASGPSDR